MVQEIDGTPIGNEMNELRAKWFQNIEEFIDHKDEIRHYEVSDSASLAEYLVMEEHCFGELPPELIKHIDFTSYGHELEQATNTSLRRAACSVIGKVVAALGRNAGLHCQLRQI